MATMLAKETSMRSQRKVVLPSDQEALITSLIECGITVHRELGPGFKETIYERAFCLELDSRNISFECEKPIEVQYKQWKIPGQRVDLIVGGVALVETKSVSKLKQLHQRQVISYLKTTGLRVGLVMNFNAVLFKYGLRRVVL